MYYYTFIECLITNININKFLTFINNNYFINITLYINCNQSYVEKLSNLIADQELDFRRLTNGIRSRRSRTRINRERDTKIFNAQTDLVNKRYYFLNFVTLMC